MNFALLYLLVVILIKHKPTICDQITCRSCQGTWLPSDRKPSTKLTIIGISLPIIPSGWLNGKKPIKLSWHSQTAPNIGSNSKRWTTRSNKPTLSPRTTSTWTKLISRIKAIAKHIIVGFNCFTCLRNVWTNEWDQTHLQN
jgi:hypothetical protein